MTGEGGGGAVALRDTQWRAWMLLGHWGMGWCVWVREGEQRINAHGKKPPHAPRVLDLRPAFFLSTVTCISAIASRLRLAEPPPSGGGRLGGGPSHAHVVRDCHCLRDGVRLPHHGLFALPARVTGWLGRAGCHGLVGAPCAPESTPQRKMKGIDG